MGEWSAHGTSWYNCNRYDPKTEAKDPQSKSRASLERYLHYYNRYANHEQSAKLEKETYARIERRMEEIQNHSSLSWIEVQFLKKAVDVLSDCRNVLKWTYAMAFYLEKVNATHIFEDNQRYVARYSFHAQSSCTAQTLLMPQTADCHSELTSPNLQ